MCHFLDKALGAACMLPRPIPGQDPTADRERRGEYGDGKREGRAFKREKAAWFAAMVALTLLLPTAEAWAWPAKVVRVLDGDSLLVRRGRIEVEVRLYGIDAPEYGQAGWGAARRNVQELMAAGQAEIEPMDKDHYGRTVALVTSGGHLVNRELVRSGYAWAFRRYCTVQPLCREFSELEALARSQGRGLWRGGSPEPPWQWKERRRREGRR